MNSDSDNDCGQNRITTALLLAAGTGSRLFPLTQNAPKCLTLVNDKSILERLINNLKTQGFKRLVIVTGHEQECIMNFLGEKSGDICIEYVHSPLYKTTNNIYSLWMARNIINEPFVLFESDLVLNSTLLDNMVYPDRMAVALMQPWLNGTTVSIDHTNNVTQFQKGTTESYSDIRYKTVNIYSFSLSSWLAIVKNLNKYISAGSVNCYYETVFSEMVDNKSLRFESVSFDNKPWYEIDNMKDLAKAELLFPSEVRKFAKFENAFA
ncbi:phosphocholine cytidylyltransferase family protein [Flavivirga spongiicola]|uniref:Phosphocholine cytidylyltransferase family protein n=1 Tax=Flavivirga spongiicola TaxID=421621 RepID=A0ABU7XM67_9FLAO|nr:phosphocholine cytidylyltransferase family protein [Flavivirga sp. MEBiC05379]MDO5981507.1 phosphocholine cytidylyltransferase family protein [Flavivirga sp. MEBiC05379]